MNKNRFHPLPPLLQSFFTERLMAQRQLSPATIASYRDTARLLLGYVQEHTSRTPTEQYLEDWDAPCVLSFLHTLEKERGNTVRTRNLRLTAVHAFMGFVAQQQPSALALCSRVLAIPAKRCDRPLLGYLTPPQMQAILRAPSVATASGQRDRLLFELMYNTGARVSEIVALNRQDLHREPVLSVELRGKGRKRRQMPLWPSTWGHLQDWLAHHPGPPNAPLFTNHSGQRLSRFGIEQRLRRAVAAALPRCPSLRGRRVSPHVIRHTTAMHLLQAGTDITVIALWLGHESPATTHQYLELDLASKRECLDKLAPGKVRNKRFKPNDELLDFLKNLSKLC